MARGDYADIVFKTGPTVEKTRIQAMNVGGSVEVETGKAFFTVTEMGRNEKPIVTARFAASEVVAIIEGKAPLPTKLKASK